MSAYRRTPRAVSHVPDLIEERIAETWRRTREGQSAGFIAECLRVQPRTVVRYRDILRKRQELPGETPPTPEQIPMPVHLTVRMWREPGNRGYDARIACGAPWGPPRSRARSWGIRREITCPDCRKVMEAQAV